MFQVIYATNGQPTKSNFDSFSVLQSKYTSWVIFQQVLCVQQADMFPLSQSRLTTLLVPHCLSVPPAVPSSSSSSLQHLGRFTPAWQNRRHTSPVFPLCGPKDYTHLEIQARFIKMHYTNWLFLFSFYLPAFQLMQRCPRTNATAPRDPFFQVSWMLLSVKLVFQNTSAKKRVSFFIE